MDIDTNMLWFFLEDTNGQYATRFRNKILSTVAQNYIIIPALRFRREGCCQYVQSAMKASQKKSWKVLLTAVIVRFPKFWLGSHVRKRFNFRRKEWQTIRPLEDDRRLPDFIEKPPDKYLGLGHKYFEVSLDPNKIIMILTTALEHNGKVDFQFSKHRSFLLVHAHYDEKMVIFGVTLCSLK